MVNSLVNAAGSGLFLAGSALYYTRVVGLSNTQLGLGLSIASGFGLLASLPVGRMADRMGAGRMLVLLHLWRAALFLAVIALHGFWPFLLVVSAITVADRSVRPVNQAMVGDLLPDEDRLRTMARVRAAANSGLAIGSALAGLLLAAPSSGSFRLIILGNAVSFAMAACLIGRLSRYAPLIREDAAPVDSRPPAAQARSGKPLRDLRFLLLTLFNGVLTLHNSVLMIALPLWIAQDTSAPVAMVSVSLAVNTVLTAVGQTRWAAAASDPRRASTMFGICGVVLASSCALLACAHYTGPVFACVLLLVGVVALTTGENMQSAAAWQISFAYPPREQRSTYLSVFNMGQSGETMVGPSMVTGLVLGAGLIGWGVLGCLFVAFGAASCWSGRTLTLRLGTQKESSAVGAAT
ncbi:MFS transporter [Streptomyces canus]|uniref:MFS transporter n=1 Tax=Streptomyces canus TaxID=58343 RepID=UPI0033A27351